MWPSTVKHIQLGVYYISHWQPLIEQISLKLTGVVISFDAVEHRKPGDHIKTIISRQAFTRNYLFLIYLSPLRAFCKGCVS